MLRYLAVALCALTSALANSEGVYVEKPEPESEKPEPKKSGTHTVRVGWSGFKFTPNVTQAKVGDIVEFHFYPLDHSVIRAHYEHGCIPFENVGGEKAGFYSGPQIVSGISDENPTFRVEINDTGPIFFYCGAPGSCTDKHMIGAINLNKAQTLEGHLKFVEQADFQLIPGEDWGSEEDGKDGGSGSKPDSAATPATSANPITALLPGVIAGIVIGSVAVLIVSAALIYLCGRRGGKDHAYRGDLPGPWGNGRVQSPANPFGFGGDMEQRNVTPMGIGAAREWSPRLASPAPAGPGYAVPAQQQELGLPIGTHLTGSTVSGDPRTVSQTMATPPPQTPLVELPASQDPGNSPLPIYRQFSWRKGGESQFRLVK